MRILELLLEHNIINLPDLEAWVNKIAERVEFPEGQEWMRSKGRKYLVNCDDTSDRISGLSPNAPEYLQKRYEEGVPLHRFRANGEVENNLNHLGDWLNSLHHTANLPFAANKAEQRLAADAKAFLPKIGRLNVEQALEQAEKWFERVRLSTQVSNGAVHGGLAKLATTNVGTWYELMTAEALKYEGKMMGHCVGGGGYTVGEGSTTRIFSLRNEKNEPHVTIEARHNQIQQVKGKQNKAPVAKYHEAVKVFLNQLGMSVGSGSSDLGRCGIFYKDGKFGSVIDVGKVVATIDGVQLVEAPDMNGYSTDPMIYVFKKNIYAKFKITNKRAVDSASAFVRTLADYNDDMCDNDGIKNAVWKIVAQYLNSLDPVPVPHSEKLLYSTTMEKYGSSRSEIAEDVGELDGYTLKKISRKSGTDLDMYKGNELALTLHAPKMKYNHSMVKAENVNEALVPTPETIIKALGKLEFTSTNLMNLGVWWKKDVGPVPFSPEAFQMVEIAPGLYGQVGGTSYSSGYYSGGEAIYIFNAKGQSVSGISHNYGIKTNDHSSAIRQNLGKVAEWLNKAHFDAPTKREYIANMRNAGLVRKAGKWVAVTTGRALYTEGEYVIQAAGKAITVSDGTGDILITADREPMTFEVKKWGRGTAQKLVGAVLALQNFGQTPRGKGAKVNTDPDHMHRIGLVGDPNEDLTFKTWVKMKDVFNLREIKTYPDGSKWKVSPYNTVDAKHSRGGPSERNYSLRDAENTRTLCRVYTDKQKRIYMILVAVEENKLATANEDLIVGHVPAIQDLIDAEGLGVDGKYFVEKLKHTVKDGKLVSLGENPRLEDFANGFVNYEDGHQWKRHDTVTWYLHHTEDKRYGNWDKKLMTVTVSPKGLKKVDFEDERLQSNPREYMGYLHDLIDLIKERDGN